MHNLVTSYDFQIGQNHWTWIWIYSLHTVSRGVLDQHSECC